MVERQLPKLNVAGSNPVSRSSEKSLDFVDISTISGFFLFKGGASYTAVSDSESRSLRATAYENLHGKYKRLPHLDAESVFFASL